ncbi:MAG: HD domain-containing protein [Minisyncoccia bacterium]|jgi:putative hydrolase of HD superfamily
MKDRIDTLLSFLEEAEKLKLVERRNRISGGKRPESSAEHSYDLALWAVVLSQDLPRSLDLLRTLELILAHDLVEIYAGDTFLFDHAARRSKKAREDAAAKKLFGRLPSDLMKKFHRLWAEFEAGRTKEAKVAISIDRLQPMLQGLASGTPPWKKHGITEAELQKYKRAYMLHDKNILTIYERLLASARRKRMI